MLTGISGSYTVEIASTIPGVSASVRAASGTSADTSLSPPGLVGCVAPSGSVVVTGGTLRPLQHSLVNPFAAPMLAALRCELAFIGCNGIHPLHGVTNVNLPEAEIKTLAMRSAARSVLVADGSKLGHVDPAVIGTLAEFDRLITAGEAPAGAIAALRLAGLDVVAA